MGQGEETMLDRPALELLAGDQQRAKRVEGAARAAIVGAGRWGGGGLGSGGHRTSSWSGCTQWYLEAGGGGGPWRRPSGRGDLRPSPPAGGSGRLADQDRTAHPAPGAQA